MDTTTHTTQQPEYLDTLIADEATMATGTAVRRAAIAGPSEGFAPEQRSATPLVVLAALATVVLIAALAFALVGRQPDPSSAAPVPSTPDRPATTDVPSGPAVVAEPTPLVPVAAPPLPDEVDGDAGEPAVAVPPAAPTPSAPDTTVPPPPPGPAPVLAAQAEYSLDPGVTAVTVTLQNQGDATLHYELVDDGDGFSADQPIGEIAAGGLADVWVELDVESDGDGPTPIERLIRVESDGGDLDISIVGQVEKPGYLVAGFDSLPLVDYRATLTFTNVGGLPLEIVGVDAPGLRLAPLPDRIAAGETIDIDVAICAGDADLPVMVPIPHPSLPIMQFQIGSWVVIETDQNADSTQLTSWTLGFEPPSCAVVVDVGAVDLVVGS